MGISSSLSNALTGLMAASRAAEVVSSNVANALTEGYGRRTVELSARSLAGTGIGVQVVGIRRNIDQAAMSDRRSSDAMLGRATVQAAFYQRIESVIGSPGAEGSLAGRLAALEASLISATSRPDSEARLAAVMRTAVGLADQINAISDDVQAARMQADAQIGKDVATVNEALQRVEVLNREIRLQRTAGNDASALMDLRQQQVDRITAILPVREVPRDHDQIALFTPGGAVLLEGNAAVLGFAPAGVITPDMTLASTALSGLTINGRAVVTGGDFSPIAGGSMAANFTLRDDQAVGMQAQLDAVSRDLVERFASPAADATLAPGDAGLFTDAGLAFTTGDEVGLAGRLRVNALADPDQGGALWRLRDGLGAAAPGEVGNAAGLLALISVMNAARIPVSGSFLGAERTISGLAADFLSMVGADRQAAEADESFAAARHSAFRSVELESGVDTDQEMQSLLQIEQAYGANAKVVQTIDDMIQTLIRI